MSNADWLVRFRTLAARLGRNRGCICKVSLSSTRLSPQLSDGPDDFGFGSICLSRWRVGPSYVPSRPPYETRHRKTKSANDSPVELQGHAIKNQDLLIASGAVTLKGTDSFAELEEDVEAVRVMAAFTNLIDLPRPSRLDHSSGPSSNKARGSSLKGLMWKLGIGKFWRSPGRSHRWPSSSRTCPTW